MMGADVGACLTKADRSYLHDGARREGRELTYSDPSRASNRHMSKLKHKPKDARIVEAHRQNRALMEAASGKYRIEVRETICLTPTVIRREDGRVIVSVKTDDNP